MKKSTVLAFVISMCILVLTGCACQHTWTEASCTAPKTCSKCAETEGTALSHMWKDATREAPKTCDRCRETEGQPLTLQEAYPEGQLRFEDGHFLMNTEDLLDLYVLELKKNGYSFERTDMIDQQSEDYVVHYLEDTTGRKISVAIVEDSQTSLISVVSAGVPLDITNLDAANELMTAATFIYDTCHGAMTDEKWDQLNNTMEYSLSESNYVMRSRCDNLGYFAGTSLEHYEVMVIADMTNSLMQ